MKYSVKFFPERRKAETMNVPIRLRVSYASQRMEFYTGKRCNIDTDPHKSQWDPVACRMKRNQIAPNGQTTTLFNADLNKLNVAIDELFKGYIASKVIPSPEQVRNDLKRLIGKRINASTERVDFFGRFDQYLEEAPLSPGRKKHMRTTYNKSSICR